MFEITSLIPVRQPYSGITWGVFRKMLAFSSLLWQRWEESSMSFLGFWLVIGDWSEMDVPKKAGESWRSVDVFFFFLGGHLGCWCLWWNLEIWERKKPEKRVDDTLWMICSRCTYIDMILHIWKHVCNNQMIILLIRMNIMIITMIIMIIMIIIITII